jgi:hypothetical protein
MRDRTQHLRWPWSEEDGEPISAEKRIDNPP